jgi:predicted amidohydrolase
MQDIRIAALQLESVAGDKDTNFRKLARFAEEAERAAPTTAACS